MEERFLHYHSCFLRSIPTALFLVVPHGLASDYFQNPFTAKPFIFAGVYFACQYVYADFEINDITLESSNPPGR